MTYRKLRWFTAIGTTFPYLCGVSAQADNSDIQSAIHRLAHGPNRLAAKAELERASMDMVVPQLVRAIREDRAFLDDGIRFLGYQVLMNKGAARTSEGFDLFIQGIPDDVVAVSCVRALRQAPVARYGEVVAAFGAALPNANAALTTEILYSVAILRSAALELRAQIASMVEESADMKLVSAASYALLRIGDHKTLLRIVEKSTFGSTTRMGIMMALARYGSETKGSFGVDEAARAVFRKLVIDGADSAIGSVRATAVQSMIPVFGEDAFVKTASTFIVNPLPESLLDSGG